jgi:hypothetical protein
MKSTFLVILFSISFISFSFGQDEPIKVKRHAIGLVPQYAFVNGFRPDFDFTMGHNYSSWLIVSPQFYLAPDNPNLFDYKKMAGIGIELQHRKFLKPDIIRPEGFYLGYGPVFQYYSVDDERLHAETIIENGIEYTVVRNGMVNTRIYKAGLTATGGYQFVVSNTLYVDLYVGTGIRLSFDDTGTGGFHKIYNNWWGDYGYSGTLLTAGLRFGMLY